MAAFRSSIDHDMPSDVDMLGMATAIFEAHRIRSTDDRIFRGVNKASSIVFVSCHCLDLLPSTARRVTIENSHNLQASPLTQKELGT